MGVGLPVTIPRLASIKTNTAVILILMDQVLGAIQENSLLVSGNKSFSEPFVEPCVEVFSEAAADSISLLEIPDRGCPSTGSLLLKNMMAIYEMVRRESNVHAQVRLFRDIYGHDNGGQLGVLGDGEVT